eukprot:TRINITY_DN9088_c0_g2_i1.p4 TRINITY_DN9088_c0_g2~~TRINITY_DN9088_c0_g2_i1.p4  ORF type:complete len:114 (-),score=13.94 TRINITY_DN9088_c0_g2_i1:699-1040(-)
MSTENDAVLPGPDSIQVDSEQIAELRETKDELLTRVQTLKKELSDWRDKLDDQMKTYRSDLGDLRNSLNAEVEALREQFRELRGNIKAQLEVTQQLAETEGSKAAKASAQLTQ